MWRIRATDIQMLFQSFFGTGGINCCKADNEEQLIDQIAISMNLSWQILEARNEWHCQLELGFRDEIEERPQIAD